MIEYFGLDGYRVESYGYYAKPTELVNSPYSEIFIFCLEGEKNSELPGVFIDIIEN